MIDLLKIAFKDSRQAVLDAWRGTKTISFSKDEKLSCFWGMLGFLCPVFASFFARRFNCRKLKELHKFNERKWVFTLSNVAVSIGWILFFFQLVCVAVYFYYWKVIQGT